MSIDGMLAFEEGRKRRAYADTLGNATIGIGHTGPEVRVGLEWNDDQIDDAYQLDKASAWQACVDHFRWFVALDDARQAVMWSMMFQMGPQRMLRFVDTLAHAAAGRYAEAASGMRDSVWGRQTPLRVAREAEQFETGVWNPNYLENTHGA